ncbi:DEAD/DEAH box helicase [Paenibacillus sp. 1P07SE]|uniref:DEAD/DEAH box helicase n=1 Tax=Paenibacillus sp. 1P07SE TaxID=3132209 RepID=UPI0039A696BE
MSKPMETKSWIVDGRWLPGEGLWLSGAGWQGSVQRLKYLLFAWHAGSWYGAEAEERRVDGYDGLLLPPLMAMDYASSPQPVRLLAVQWSAQASLLLTSARLIRRCLLHGWYAPQPAGWQAGGQRWQLWLPASDRREEADTAALEAADPVVLHDWLSLAVDEAIARDPGAAAAAQELSGRLRGGEGGEDEEEWWVAAGWKRDDTPFRILLQLLEPGEHAGWRLAIVLQDKDRTARRFVVQRGQGSLGWTAYPEDEEAALEFPGSWKTELAAVMEKEERRWQRVFPEWEDPLHPGRIRLALEEQEAWMFLEEGSLRLLQAGGSVLLPGWWEAARRRKPRLKAKVKSSVGSAEQSMFGLDQIVQFDWKLAVGDLDLSEEDFMQMVRENRRLLQMGNEWVHLDAGDLRRLQQWMKRSGKKRGLTFREVLELHLRGESVDMESQEEQEEGLRTEIELNQHLERWLEQLQSVSELPLIDKPAGFAGELRPYQLQGVSWLAFLRSFGLGACLADDMGLGKTIQFTAYLLHIKEIERQLASATAGHEEAGPGSSPSLLICPTSVIGNWEKELERFAPSLQTRIHYGPRRAKGEEFAAAVKGADLVITSYALAPLDEEELSSIEWNALCLDEAQNIKNIYTKQSAAIRRLPAYHRIAMTGTPMENRLTELWSIHDFMNPGYLGQLAKFRREVVQPIERTRDSEQIRRLRQWVNPFMLRRLKKDPAIQLELPEKNEARTYISLTVEQGTLYENTVSELLEKLDTLTPMQRRGLILATLTKLKQLCNHPALLLKDSRIALEQWDPMRSNKMTRLLEMIEEIAAEGERCLIFTQFVGMGRMIQQQLQKQFGWQVPYLHGAVPKEERDAMIDDFQNGRTPGCAFVLSLKAGGTGLNLTAANHVFHFDRWWNPAVENQATDRAFRIGQSRTVQVHKFVTLGTLEERIDEMIARKQMLNDQVVSASENWITELSNEELASLFTLRKTLVDG